MDVTLFWGEFLLLMHHSSYSYTELNLMRIIITYFFFFFFLQNEGSHHYILPDWSSLFQPGEYESRKQRSIIKKVSILKDFFTVIFFLHNFQIDEIFSHLPCCVFLFIWKYYWVQGHSYNKKNNNTRYK